LLIDRDTRGVPGSPPIVDTIFRKIDQAAVFVPDLTFVGNRIDGRPTPNPNVLIEYGWALKSLSHVRIVPIMNVAFGTPNAESMPFDMRHLRNPITYDCPEDADDETRKRVREALANDLESAIRDVFESVEFKNSLPKPPGPPAFKAKEPMDGPGKFRPAHEPIGVTEGNVLQGSKPVCLSDGPVIWLRVMPNADPGRIWQVRELREAATRPTVDLLPLDPGWQSLGFLRSYDGFAVYASSLASPQIALDVVIVFTSGEVWAVDACTLDSLTRNGQNAILLQEELIAEALGRYSAFLTKLGINPPHRWIAGLQGVKDRGIIIPRCPGTISLNPGPRGICLIDNIICEGDHVADRSLSQALKPFFTKVFESCGVDRPE
jgi:hypothetical protein